MQFSTDMVVMGATASDKAAALGVVAKALEDKGLVADYAKALAEREAQANTYLGNGLAIPHGTPAYKEQVKKTGVVLVHFKDGVDWGGGSVVYVAAGIAANNDEHLQILKSLAKLLSNDQLENALKIANSAEAVVQALAGNAKQSLQIYHTNTNATDSETLALMASDVLKQNGCISTGFVADMLAKSWLPLLDDTFVVQSSKAVQLPSIVVAVNDSGVAYGTAQVKNLIVLANDKGEQSQVAFDEFLDKVLINGIEKTAVGDKTAQTNYATGKVFLANRHGLHARPATVLSEFAKQFEGEVLVATDGEFVSTKSLVKLLALGAGYGQLLQFKVQDDKGQGGAFVERLIAMVNDGLGEEVSPIVHSAEEDTPHAQPQKSAEALVRGECQLGIAVSGGIAIGKAFLVQPKDFDIHALAASTPSEEKTSLDNAIRQVRADLELIIKNARTPEIAAIFTAHKGILMDEEIIKGVHYRIDEGLSAAMAWHSEIEQLAKLQASLDNPVLAERAADLKDIGRRVLAAMMGESDSLPTGNYILVKDEILPSDVAVLGEEVIGIITKNGGASGHSAIIARSLGIPALVGAKAALEIAKDEQILINAEEGYFVASPNDELIKQSLLNKARLQEKLDKAKKSSQLPAITTDNHRVEVAVNLGDVLHATQAVESGAEGVGLLRTELVFMKHNKMPDEATQIIDYNQVFDAMDGKPVVVRTLDVGGDKPLPYLTMKKEDNPFLGVRGIRLSLNRPELLKSQLIALIKSSNNRPLAIMFPMVGQLEEWHQAKAILNEVLETYPHDNLQVGIMIEVPSAALLAEHFAKEVDFFSIGTNDLVQYTLAIDRGHPLLSNMADGLNPAVLGLIDKTVKAAHAHGKWVGVCGELGSDALAVPVLIGLGVDELSVSANQIALVKDQVRSLSFAECQTLVNQALALTTANEVRQLVKEKLTA